MKRSVTLSLRGVQTYPGQEPDVIEFVTDGILEENPDGWNLSYDESSLTGLEGVKTTFLLQQDCVTLRRTGKLRSEMVFQKGMRHESLYQMDFGALMICVCAQNVQWKINLDGGVVDLKYQIDIEHGPAGTVDYHLEIKPQ